jgi:hypothetical protein
MQRVLDVESIDIFLIKTNPPKLLVVARGHVPTTGWTLPQLGPWFYLRPPDDGVQDFDFLAQEPRRHAGDVVLPIAAEQVIAREPLNYWGKGHPLKGVRIHARSNTLEYLLGEPDALKPAISTFGGGGEPFPLGLFGGSDNPFPLALFGGGSDSPFPLALFPGASRHPSGGDGHPWPWPPLAVLAAPYPWPWPWSTDKPARVAEASGTEDVSRDPIGKILRVYHTGDMITQDWRADRMNVELSPVTDRIVRIWFG